MKNKIEIGIVAAFFAITNMMFSQEMLWEKSYGGINAEYMMDAIPTADYGFILAGSSLSNKSGNSSEKNKGNLDYSIWKLNENGDLDWQKNFGGSGKDLLQSVVLTNDGGFILAGVSSSNKSFDKKEDSRGDDDFWIIKLNAKGSEEWQVTIGGGFQEKSCRIKATADGGYILGGTSSSEKSFEKSEINFGNDDFWVIRLNSKGKIEWQKTFGGIYADELRSVDTTFDSGFILGGYSNSPASGNKTDDNIGIGDYWILKLNKKGEIEWQKTIGGNGDDQLSVICKTYDKGYILGGYSNSSSGQFKSKTNAEGTDLWILKIDEKGNTAWQQTYNFAKSDVLTSIVENKDHSLLIGGYAKGEFTTRNSGKIKAQKGTDDYIALKISEKGEELWSESVGSDGRDILKKVIETRDGGYLFAGYSNPIASSQASQNSKGPLSGLSHSNENNQAVEDFKNDANRQITNTSNEVNQNIKDYTSNVTDKINEGTGLGKDSPLKLGVNDQSNPLNLGKVGDGKNGANSPTPFGATSTLPRSGDKGKSFGSNDFWVVKLRDKNKPTEEKAAIEAYPNPSKEFTNVIVGYDYQTGKATVVDLAGHVLETFDIIERIIPIDLSKYPEGIYIVNIKTNVQSDGIKIIKRTSK